MKKTRPLSDEYVKESGSEQVCLWLSLSVEAKLSPLTTRLCRNLQATRNLNRKAIPKGLQIQRIPRQYLTLTIYGSLTYICP